MAAYIPVPRDLTRVKTKVFFNLTKRQLLCFGAAVIITYSPQKGVILLVMAFLISPMGLPLAAIWLLGKVQSFIVTIFRKNLME